MTLQRVLCPTSATWHGKHFVMGDHHWTVTEPGGSTVTLCSATCALSWLVYALPADVTEGHKSSGLAERHGAPDQEAA